MQVGPVRGHHPRSGFFCDQSVTTQSTLIRDKIFVFMHPHLSVFVSLSPFSVSLRHLRLGQLVSCMCVCVCVCVCVYVCACVAPGCLHVVVILGLMKEFSAPPPPTLLRRSPRLGLGWGEGEKDEGGNGKGTQTMTVGGGQGKERGFCRIKAFYAVYASFFFLFFFPLHSSCACLSDCLAMFDPGVLQGQSLLFFNDVEPDCILQSVCLF